MVNKLNRNDLIYQTGNKKKDRTYDFQKFKTIRFFGRGIHKNNFSLDDALEQQIILKDDIDILKNLSNQKNHSKRKKKAITLSKMQLYFLMEGKKFFMLLKVEYFQKENKEKDLQVFQIA